MKCINSILLAIAMLLATPAFFSSCQEDATKIVFKEKVSVTNDFTKVVEAINNETQKNEEAISKLTSAIDKLSGEQGTKIQLITNVLNDVNTKLDTKLVAIEAAMRAQTLSFESKFDLLRKAIESHTLKMDELSGKLTTAIDALNGTLDKKIAALTAIIKSSSATTAEKLAIIDATMAAQRVELSKKLALLITAVDNNTLESKDLSKKLAEAIDALNVTVDKKLLAIKVIIKNTSTTTAEKLAALGGFIKAHTAAFDKKMEALHTAIENLPDHSDRLQAIADAIKAQPDLSLQLESIETAIKAIPNYSDKFDAVIKGLNTIKIQIGLLGTGQTDMVAEITNVETAIRNLIKETNSGTTNAETAMETIKQELSDLNDFSNGFVDLGLPSGLKWAVRNLGAKNIEDRGDFYAWGETEPKADYSWATYKWCVAGDPKRLTKYTTQATYAEGGTPDNKTTLEPEDDAATVKLGSPWRIPSQADYLELLQHCKWTWRKINGIGGWIIASKTSRKRMFLPVTGWRVGTKDEYPPIGMGTYWMNSILPTINERSLEFHLEQLGIRYDEERMRWIGNPVRAVRP